MVLSDFRFFAFNKISDWSKGLAYNLQLTDMGMSISMREKASLEKIISGESLDRFSELTDFTVSGYNMLYILDQSLNLWIYDYVNGGLEKALDNSTGLFSRYSRIKIHNGVLYIADPLLPNKLSAVSVNNGQILWTIRDISGFTFLPVDLAVDGAGNCYAVSPRNADLTDPDHPVTGENDNLVVVKVDRTGRVANLVFAHFLRVPVETDVIMLKYHLFITARSDGMCYVLNTFDNKITKISTTGEFMESFSLPDICRPFKLELDEQGLLYTADLQSGAFNDNEERIIRVFNDQGMEIGDLSGYRGKLHNFVLDYKKRIFVYNHKENSITILKREPVIDAAGSGLPTGVFISPAFDTGDSETVWHKFEIDAEIPKDTQIKVSYFSSEFRQFMLEGERYYLDELLVAEGLSSEQKVKLLEPLWTQTVVNARDALMNKATGRYLWVKIELVGSNQKTPLLKGISLHYPRSSYLQYLPAIYQDNPGSKDFLERFLSLYSTFYSDMEDRITNVTAYMDVGAVTGDFLRWLAGWLGICVDESWTDERLRSLLRKAFDIHRLRGTRQGIETVIGVYTGEKPFIVEQFQLKKSENSSAIRDLLEQLYGTNPYEFYVLLKPDQVKDNQEREAIQKILEDQKPAYTDAKLVLLQPWIYLDRYTYLGVNTFLSEPTLLKLDDKARLPNNTVLIDVDDNI